jgi:NADPH:quinone reductase-like Zn-dependent oxidoreductase
MKAMVLNKLCNLEETKTPLELVNLPDPVPGEKEILVKVSVVFLNGWDKHNASSQNAQRSIMETT